MGYYDDDITREKTITKITENNRSSNKIVVENGSKIQNPSQFTLRIKGIKV